ncbi:GAF domain-containing sensor histidine kinase [cf. Phormidesmis sp. LEGE 11477]|uniref:sensor histidine kinase n=1 Tax=cf. Phormidesmis sp. LEGE 11477 TaxID=1828680 RepID=UPI00187F1670|nr:ATP-binding protein [cf. Phormidesmis sp. LEGE 11477]MBE9059375.1 GAF domain-containing protein [cf. Phormidesmis sp. LEGE 11477]
MQTPHYSIANQEFSLSAYQRLRESLMRQEPFFNSVMTAAQLAEHRAAEPHHKVSPQDETQLDKTLASKTSGNTSDTRSISGVASGGITESSDIAEVDFVLMRSPSLSVLLTAKPLASSPSTALFSNRASLNHELLSQASSNSSASVPYASTGSVSVERAHLSPDINRHASLNLSPLSQRQPNIHHAPHADHNLSLSSAYSKPDYRSEHSKRSEHLEKITKSHTLDLLDSKANLQKADRYLVNLTIDNIKIEAFMTELKSSAAVSEISSNIPRAKTPGSKSSPESAGNHCAAAEDSSPLLQDAFFLSWAKELATSPEGDRQLDQPTALRNEIEQSLLLNQVITRIRHSLDLPSILETTVAQVREFLLADRLVIYQFNSTDEAQRGVHLGKHFFESTTHSSATDTDQTSDAIVGHQVHAGQVTYESRLSEEISSVLNFSEASCFCSTLPTYSHYLMGQPVAVNNVDEKYAETSCLLDFLHEAQIKSKIIAPIIIKGQLWGLLIAHQCKNYRNWHKTEAVFLQHIAEHLAVAIEQASLYHQLRQQKTSLESCVVERTRNLQDALAAAAAADRTKGEFLSTMSHELRTPLTYIIGMSATLLRWSFGELSDRQRSYLNTINHSGEQLLTVINDILEFAKVESGRSLLNVSAFPLSNLVYSVVNRHQEAAKNHNVSLSVDCAIDPDSANFLADFERMEQILSNLVDNAVKFTPAGGQVVIRVQKELDAIVLQVEDTGIGIPESQQQFLFEKFKQLESPFQRQYSGTGLGLAMTKHLVELHDGTIQVTSAVGKGSTFMVSLPIRSKPNLSDRYRVPPTLERTTKPVVLLLETEENSAAIICELLTADGYEVIWLTLADDIAVQVTLLKPALLIADLALLSHRQDDIKAIEQSVTAVGTRVLALLGQSTSASSHIAHHDTLDKPVNPKNLIEKSRQLTLPNL